MKQLIVFFLVGFLASNVNAQDKGAVDYNNDGVASYKAKDYKSAYESFSKAIELYKAEGAIVDDNLIYNTGYCALKAKKYEEAIPYFEKSIVAKVKDAKPHIYLTQSYFKLKKKEEMEIAVLAGLELYPTDKTLNKYAGVNYLKQGLVYYKKGNNIKKKANESGMNETDPDAFNAEYVRADVEFNKALPLLEKAYSYDAKSKNTLKALGNVYSVLKMDDKATKVKGELEAL